MLNTFNCKIPYRLFKKFINKNTFIQQSNRWKTTNFNFYFTQQCIALSNYPIFKLRTYKFVQNSYLNLFKIQNGESTFALVFNTELYGIFDLSLLGFLHVNYQANYRSVKNVCYSETRMCELLDKFSLYEE